MTKWEYEPPVYTPIHNPRSEPTELFKMYHQSLQRDYEQQRKAYSLLNVERAYNKSSLTPKGD